MATNDVDYTVSTETLFVAVEERGGCWLAVSAIQKHPLNGGVRRLAKGYNALFAPFAEQKHLTRQCQAQMLPLDGDRFGFARARAEKEEQKRVIAPTMGIRLIGRVKQRVRSRSGDRVSTGGKETPNLTSGREGLSLRSNKGVSR